MDDVSANASDAAEMSSAEFAESVRRLLPPELAAEIVVPEQCAVVPLPLRSPSETGGIYAKRRNLDGTVSRISVLQLLALGNDGGKVSNDRIERQRRRTAGACQRMQQHQ